MRETVKQTKPDWTIHVRVVDREARATHKKCLVYEYSGNVRAENVETQVTDAVISMQHYAKEWKSALPTNKAREV